MKSSSGTVKKHKYLLVCHQIILNINKSKINLSAFFVSLLLIGVYFQLNVNLTMLQFYLFKKMR